jgi:hypothetical protein
MRRAWHRAVPRRRRRRLSPIEIAHPDIAEGHQGRCSAADKAQEATGSDRLGLLLVPAQYSERVPAAVAGAVGCGLHRLLFDVPGGSLRRTNPVIVHCRGARVCAPNARATSTSIASRQVRAVQCRFLTDMRRLLVRRPGALSVNSVLVPLSGHWQACLAPPATVPSSHSGMPAPVAPGPCVLGRVRHLT